MTNKINGGPLELRAHGHLGIRLWLLYVYKKNVRGKLSANLVTEITRETADAQPNIEIPPTAEVGSFTYTLAKYT